jgi:hypothetical protein
MIVRDMPAVEAAINEDSWNYLQDAWPEMAAAVAKEVQRGVQPDEIRRYVLRKVGEQRSPIALRCAQAAAHLHNQNGDA